MASGLTLAFPHTTIEAKILRRFDCKQLLLFLSRRILSSSSWDYHTEDSKLTLVFRAIEVRFNRSKSSWNNDRTKKTFAKNVLQDLHNILLLLAKIIDQPYLATSRCRMICQNPGLVGLEYAGSAFEFVENKLKIFGRRNCFRINVE